jgi:hypothetical protein
MKIHQISHLISQQGYERTLHRYLFFTMRCCKYLNVSGTRKTKTLCLRNFRFFKGTRRLKHNGATLHKANTVSITFEDQKWDTKNNTITHHQNDDPTLCPVKIWAKIVRRISSYPLSTPNTTVNIFQLPSGKSIQFTGPQLLKCPDLAAESIGSSKLGFTPDQLGLHSA